MGWRKDEQYWVRRYLYLYPWLCLVGEKSPTTVCRGIAPFITGFAHTWGMEAYVATLQKNGMGHVVALVRGKGEKQSVINRGEGFLRVEMAHFLKYLMISQLQRDILHNFSMKFTTTKAIMFVV